MATCSTRPGRHAAIYPPRCGVAQNAKLGAASPGMSSLGYGEGERIDLQRAEI
jgi:hypothetical protein